ncbi:putative transcription initiation factor IIE subunit alpha, TFIIEalpha/SarR/Rpc3 HTH [Arabidopsis thaliana]
MKKVVFYINVEFVSNANLIQTLACSPWKNQVRWLCASHLSSNSLYNTTFLFLSIAIHFFYQNLCSSNAFINRFCISYVCFASIFRMVKLVAKTFYDNYTPKNNNQKKSAKNGSGGIAVLVLDALTRRQWVREEDLAKELKLNTKQLRTILRYFEEQQFIMRVHRKEKSSATTNGRGEDKVKVHMYSYCCLDYSQIYDVIRYKLHRMKKEFKDVLEDKDNVQEYGCPNCKRKIFFHCENCNGELVMECNKLTSEEVVVDGSDNPRSRRDHLKDLLQNMEVRLKPLMDHINRIKDLPVPSFESFPAWETRVAKAARENGDLNPDDTLRPQGGYGSTPMPFLGETEIEVNLGEENEDVKSDEVGDSSRRKLTPSWLIKKGMNLSDEQRGEIRHEAKADDGGSSMENGDDDRNLKDEYLKAYYAAILEEQELAEKLNQQESAGKVTTDIELATSSSDRQVGMKSKREEEEEEEASVAANGNYKVDLNVEAEEAEQDENDVDWQEC